MKSIVGAKSELFAVRIINLYKFLYNKKKELVISKQILRSGTSIGANLSEADFAMTKKEFLTKISISIKECSETLYWLRLLYKTEYITQKQFDSLYAECEELMRMLTAAVKTTKRNIEEK